MKPFTRTVRTTDAAALLLTIVLVVEAVPPATTNTPHAGPYAPPIALPHNMEPFPCATSAFLPAGDFPSTDRIETTRASRFAFYRDLSGG